MTARIPDGPLVARYLVADERAEAELIAAEIERAVGGTDMLAMGDGRAVEESPEPRQLAFHDIAVLTRLSAQQDAIAEALDRISIPSQRSCGDALMCRPHVADLLGRLQRLVERKGRQPLSDAIAHLDEAAALDRGRRRAVELLCALALPFGDDLDGFRDSLALSSDADLALAPQRVSLLTLHASKGLEFPLVFIAGCEDGLVPLRLPWLKPANLDEERRLLYVGMTRAKQRLVLTAARQRSLLGRTVGNAPCPFLADVPPGLLEAHHVKARVRRPRQLSLL